MTQSNVMRSLFNVRAPAALRLLIALLAFAAPSYAQVVVTDVSGEIEVAVAPPPSVQSGAFVSQTHIRLIQEGPSAVVAGLPAFLYDSAYHNPSNYGSESPGRDSTFYDAVTTPYAGPGLPPVGTEVSSVLLHFDADLSGLPYKLKQGITRTGTISFDRQILGVYVTSEDLNATDSIFNPGGVLYDTIAGRDMEFNTRGDQYFISTDRYTLSLAMYSHDGGAFDEMRVILAPGPPPPTFLPDVVGRTEAQATAMLRSVGLNVTILTQASSTVPLGSVISQDPMAGSPLVAGSNVFLTVSSGVTVPDVVGQSDGAATAALEAEGLVVVKSIQRSTTAPIGSVIGQDPAVDTHVSGGATVALIISIGNPSFIEYGSTSVGGTHVTVPLQHPYEKPVVVASARYANNTIPVVVRVSNVTPTSFDVRLQNPAGGAVAAETVSYLVVEEGVWTIDGVKIEARSYLSSATASATSWSGELRSYGQTYTNPVVIGQVMSENDPAWSAFWARGSTRSNPPSATTLRIGKMVGEDPITARAAETIGYVVIEAGHGTLAGVEFEAAVGAATIKGAVDGAPFAYTFGSAFARAPRVAVVSQAGMKGTDGAWAQTYGATIATSTSLLLSVDEDDIGDAERNHVVSEQVAYAVFGRVPNTAPIAADEAIGTAEDTAVLVNALGNDSDADGDSLSISAVTQPAFGSVINSGSHLTYVPSPNVCAVTDLFSYTVSDGEGGADTATVTVTVLCVNDQPVVVGDVAVTPRDVQIGINVLANDSDADGDVLSVTLITAPGHGVAVLNGSSFTYTPAQGYCGPDSFGYSVSDGNSGSGTGSVAVTVLCPNAAPVASDQAVSTDEDLALDLLLIGSDSDGDSISFEIVTSPTHGVLNGAGSARTYVPNANYHGPDSFTFRTYDGRDLSAIATVSLTVNSVNDVPTADDKNVSTGAGQSLDVTLNASDNDGDPLSIVIVDGPAHGTLAGSGVARTYTPNAGFSGHDSFSFRANDGTSDSNLATVSIFVTDQFSTLIEFGTTIVAGTHVTVPLRNTYVKPVVVASARYANNTTPVVVRVSNVTPTSFDVRLQHPAGGFVAAETVSYLVVEEGTWTIDGVKIEARTYLSTATDSATNWSGQARAYGQTYISPVVIGQVMSENDPAWSAFWARGSTRSNAPSSTSLRTGKMVAEDPITARAAETIGYVVIEAGHGTLAGVEFEAAVGAATIKGAVDGAPFAYTFGSAFAQAPAVAVVSQAGMKGTDGSWAQTHGATVATPTSLFLSVDEDEVGDAERNHLSEQVSYLVFLTPRN